MVCYTVCCGRIVRGEAAKTVAEKKNNDEELDFDAVLADLNRQAHDKELEALANLTLLRTSFGSEDGLSENDQKQKNLDERLKKIISDLAQD